ncbi:MAG: hypothetical protein ACQESP_04405 [Candidatus Muiribacteriota bacterium]
MFFKKRGIFLPLVLFLLLVLAMLGYMFNRITQSEFRQAYFMSDMMRAQFIAEAVMHEILAESRAKMNNELRDTFIDGGQLSLGDIGKYDNFYDDFDNLEGDATTNPVSFKVDYFAECTNINQFNSTGDILGTLNIVVEADVNSVNRRIRTSWDYKVVDTRPVGNEYTFMVGRSDSNSFNHSNHFFVNAEDSAGISIGGEAVIDLHKHYNTKGEYDLSNWALHQNMNSEQSLIPGGSDDGRTQISQAADVENNEPYESSLTGQNRNSAVVDGSDPFPSDYEQEHMMDCNGGTETVDFPSKLQNEGWFTFNTGYKNGNPYTHFFGRNVEYSNVDTYGNIQKRYTVYNEKWTNSEPIMGWNPQKPGTPECDEVPKYKIPIPCQIHMNANDWTPGDTWKVDVWEEAVLKDYKTQDSNFNSSAVWQGEQTSVDLNLKGNFSDYKKTATRYVEDFPSDRWDTFLAPGSKNMYLEGVVATDNATVETGNYFKTPGMIVAEKNIEVNSSLEPDGKLSYESGEFFKQINVLSLVGFNTITNDNSKKEGTGFYSENNFNSNMDINGNITIKNLNGAKQFEGGLTYDTTLASSDFTVDGDKSYVVSLSPIPSSFIILNNMEDR